MEKKAIAYYNIGILDTIFIYDIDYNIDDCVIFKHTRQKRLHKAKIRYNKFGGAYFITYGRRVYIGCCMLIND